jgi:hypothetical protein
MLLTAACSATNVTITVPFYATAPIPGVGALGQEALDPSDLGDVISIGLMDSDDLETWGVEVEDIVSARVAWIRLETLEGDLSFLDSTDVRLDSEEFLSEAIASRDDFPRGIISAGLDLEEVELLPYISDASEARLHISAVGIPPEEETVVTMFGGFAVDVTLGGILSQMKN